MVSTILLDPNDKYADYENNLPKRPEYDKELLKAMCDCQVVSKKGYEMLPPSIQDIVLPTSMKLPDIGITIPEIGSLSDVLIVVRSDEELSDGKTFRLNKFKRIGSGNPEIWIRKER